VLKSKLSAHAEVKVICCTQNISEQLKNAEKKFLTVFVTVAW